ncbi:hypothetical protein B9Q03_03980 [Candidatus Marsarchaeota G2 archaeon OSP_D]|uniref:Uncharacterized protein n=1 Tax=Candidatus Marsarchaeota G2 archaeon OSP_D TaxID=1978157 RepID=A0A2R6AYV5_9ARCH|nr:MAG: hypothetical protein B9Q03_03980 [Candidatus Marsarchaeota G2 archaeon OSP_D]
MSQIALCDIFIQILCLIDVIFDKISGEYITIYVRLVFGRIKSVFSVIVVYCFIDRFKTYSVY